MDVENVTLPGQVAVVQEKAGPEDDDANEEVVGDVEVDGDEAEEGEDGDEVGHEAEPQRIGSSGDHES